MAQKPINPRERLIEKIRERDKMQKEEELKKLMVVYLGCVSDTQPGHFYLVNGMAFDYLRPPESLPWATLDSKELCDGGRYAHGQLWLHHKDGWTALGIVDNSVDERKNSRSVFAINRPNLDLDDAYVEILKINRYREILLRIEARGKIVLQKVMDQ